MCGLRESRDEKENNMATPLNSNLPAVVQELQTALETALGEIEQLKARLEHIEQHLQGGGGPGFNIKF
jgi:hypothetical protein